MKRLLVGSCLAFFLFSACKTTRSVPMQTVTVKPSALIGTAYDAVTQEFTGVSCLDISALTADDYEMQPLGDYSLAQSDGTDSRELEAVFGSFQKSFYTIATGLRLSRPYETVQRIREGEREVVRLLLVQTGPGSLRFKTTSRHKLQLSRQAQTLLQQILIATGPERDQLLDDFIQTCGTGFLAGTRYQLSLVASLRWIFADAADKQRWEAELRSMDLEAWPERQPSMPVQRFRYESHVKETRDISAKILGETGSKDCTPALSGPCLDAWRLFQNATLPAWQARLKKIGDEFDAVLPQAFLFEPEVISYRAIEPALALVMLESDAAQAEAWQVARERFVELYAKVLRQGQALERSGEQDAAFALRPLLQKIASEVAPCYRPLLDYARCVQNAERLQTDLRTSIPIQ